MNKANNQRVRLTKSLLQNAILDLLMETPIDKISVRELCVSAGINRSTFYLHYNCPLDVLTEIEDSFIAEMADMLEYQNTGVNLPVDQKVTIICGYLKDHERTAVALFSVYSPDSDFADKLFSLSASNMPEWNEFLKRHDPVSAELLRTYLVNGAYGLISRWLLRQIERTPEEIGMLAKELTHFVLP